MATVQESRLERKMQTLENARDKKVAMIANVMWIRGVVVVWSKKVWMVEVRACVLRALMMEEEFVLEGARLAR